VFDFDLQIQQRRVCLRTSNTGKAEIKNVSFAMSLRTAANSQKACVRWDIPRHLLDTLCLLHSRECTNRDTERNISYNIRSHICVNYKTSNSLTYVL